MNQVILIGRLTADPVLRELEDGKKVSNITLAVTRPFKNHDGQYETDFIPITLWQGIAESLNQYCVKGTQVVVTGRMQMKVNVIDEKNYHNIELVGERVTYLSSPRNRDSE